MQGQMRPWPQLIDSPARMTRGRAATGDGRASTPTRSRSSPAGAVALRRFSDRTRARSQLCEDPTAQRRLRSNAQARGGAPDWRPAGRLTARTPFSDGLSRFCHIASHRRHAAVISYSRLARSFIFRGYPCVE
jgi:hypothetical protein